ncbi:hypothetical protein PHLGIDRAFT_430995 [Phlebiopsis gigantea 11061_1 CR5-6]|uniref:Uncharacterized protein n=1 Tax=Phlebiopsis gigantea (strain 11061_1 CR5-6) TaxID=745531 RepID=A0A0C3NPQ4_PHLG1|nr:hypothetical protein PHLGIDRAFT_430995 [Phlebiopsis gigantea 11061_1 CR5-6]
MVFHDPRHRVPQRARTKRDLPILVYTCPLFIYSAKFLCQRPLFYSARICFLTKFFARTLHRPPLSFCCSPSSDTIPDLRRPDLGGLQSRLSCDSSGLSS